MENWSGLENLKNITNLTMIIWGNKDKAYNFDQINSLKMNIKNSDLSIFEGCSHNVHLEIPDKFNKCIINFLENK